MELLYIMLAAVCGMLGIMSTAIMIILLKRENRKPERAPEAEEAKEKEEKGEIEWVVTKTENPTREQQYINMLMYDGENQKTGGRG